ncbi:putative uracil phosphoribosyltransferase FUR1 [Cryptosporidium felis]|nr:putative uracil phosphoribosyltransferase FUR1 [Cryptosporidium felis]
MCDITFVGRASDGLILTETWDDLSSNRSLQSYKHQAKQILKSIGNEIGLEKCSVDSGNYVFHYIVDAGIIYMTLSGKSYPKKLAFSFLEEIKRLFVEEIKKEFANCGDDFKKQIEEIDKPYYFIKFDRVIQRCKAEYKDPNSNKSLHKLNDSLIELSLRGNNTLFCLQIIGSTPTMDPIDISTSLYDELSSKYSNLHICTQTPQLKGVMTILRDVNTKKEDFVFYADRISRIVLEHALNLLPYDFKEVETPNGATVKGIAFNTPICGVSLIGSGEAMENALRFVCRGCRIGKVLLENSSEKRHNKSPSYVRLPKDVSERVVIIMNPVLGTGNSLSCVIEVLLKNNVKEKNIICMALLSSKAAIERVFFQFPEVKLVTSSIDNALDDNMQVIPGVGNFGDRYFGINAHD